MIKEKAMNDRDRKEYWNTLCTLDGKDIESDCSKLRKTIKYPSKIYRYRPVNIDTIDALNRNKLYFSKADYYDDPFDTFINVNIRELNGCIEMIKKVDSASFEKYIEEMIKGHFKMKLNLEQLKPIVEKMKMTANNSNYVEYVTDFFRNIRNEMRKEIWSVCFSEEKYNEVLWLKYADQHRGFAVEYDLKKDENLLCGSQEKCKKCGINYWGTPLYPIYYSNTKYDATHFAQYLSLQKIVDTLNVPKEIILPMINSLGNMTWEKVKISTIKKKCHKYDREWRVIVPTLMQPPVMMEWIPSAIYLGVRMEESKVALLINIARFVGVKRVYRCFISDAGNINSKLVWKE